MALCPGTYAGTSSLQTSLYVEETAFSFLEPSIRKRSVAYARSYSHWGIMEIHREEWIDILQDWRQLGSNVTSTKTIQEFRSLCSVSERLAIEFNEAFEINKTNLLKMIDQLIDWCRSELRSHDQICVIGI